MTFLGRCLGELREEVIQAMDEWNVGFENKSAEGLIQHTSTLEIVRMEGGACFLEQGCQHRLPPNPTHTSKLVIDLKNPTTFSLHQDKYTVRLHQDEDSHTC